MNAARHAPRPSWGARDDDDPTPTEARLRFFTPDGSWVGPDQVLAPVGRPDVATDSSGNFLVMTSFSARAYDASGVALGPPVTLGPLSGAFNLHRSIRVVGRTEGGFFAMQNLGSETRVASHHALRTRLRRLRRRNARLHLRDLRRRRGQQRHHTRCLPHRLPAVTLRRRHDRRRRAMRRRQPRTAATAAPSSANPTCGTVCGDGIVAPQGCEEQCDDGDIDGRRRLLGDVQGRAHLSAAASPRPIATRRGGSTTPATTRDSTSAGVSTRSSAAATTTRRATSTAG